MTARRGVYNDFLGRQFGLWTVLEPARPRGCDARFLCHCAGCDTERIVYGKNLRNGRSKSCGRCCRPAPRSFLDLTGRQFDRWTVIALDPKRTSNRQAYWLCRCACDTERVVIGKHLRNGQSRSCGCLRRELTAKRMRKHGKSGTRSYSLWKSIKQRLFNPRNRSFHYYNGLGMEEDWRHDYMEFYRDVGDPPEDGRSFDRPNNKRGYFRDNWRWATAREQVLNRRPPKKRARIKLNDPKTLAELARLNAALARAAGARIGER